MAQTTNQQFPGDVKEKIFECIKVTEFKNPVPGKNTHVCEFVRSVPIVAERNEDGSVKTWWEPRLSMIKQYCTLPKGTKPDQVKYVEASYIALEEIEKK